MTGAQARKAELGGEVLATSGRRDMSRIGRLPIAVPHGVDVTIDGRRDGEGPEGQLSRELHPDMIVGREDGKLVVTRPTSRSSTSSCTA